MDPITYESIKNLAQTDYPGCRLSIAHLLSAWAFHDPGHQLQEFLRGTGLSGAALVDVLKPMIQHPATDDYKFVTLCLLDIQGTTLTGRDILSCLCTKPSYRITEVLARGGLDFHQMGINLGLHDPEKVGLPQHLADMDAQISVVKKFVRNLNEMALTGKFDDLVSRTSETDRLIHVLLRRKKCNAVLTGKPGIGKTVCVRLLAKQIVEKKVPDVLKNATVMELDIPGVVAGTKYRGQFEERMKRILDAVSGTPGPTILFMDEMHMLCGAGAAEGVNTDGANILKPYLTDRPFSVIGATTTEEYHRFIARDKALARRFEHILIHEPDRQTTTAIVSFQAGKLSEYHRIAISDEVIECAVQLTDTHIPDRCQPDKAIDLLDTCCAAGRSQNVTALTVRDLMNNCARLTGRDIDFLSGNDRKKLFTLRDRINRKLIGQEEAVSLVCDTLACRRLGIAAKDRPLGVFLLSGMSGTGKTTLAQLLAAEYFGNPDSLLFLDMAEYEHGGALTKLIGASPGHIGFESSPGALTRWLRANGSGVILFDEIEKAHPDVIQSLLGLMDNGRMRSSMGDLLDARQCMIMATSNAVTPQQLNRSRIGFQNTSGCPDIRKLLLNRFTGEFLNRFDHLLVFKTLDASALEKILRLRLREALIRLYRQQIVLRFNGRQMLDFLMQRLGSDPSGARGISHLLEKELLQPVSRSMIRQGLSGRLTVRLEDRFYTHGAVSILSKE